MIIKLKQFAIIATIIFLFFGSIIFSYPQRVSAILDISSEEIHEINTDIKSSIKSPIGNATVQIVTFVGAFLNISLSTVSLITGNITLIVNIGIRIWLSILYGLGIRKRNRPWGTVYDSVSKRPINLAYILLKNLEGKIVASAITDTNGRYAFLVDKGVYSMIVSKGNYIFPSHHILDKTLDDTYPDTYWGDFFEIKEKGEVINRNIPLDKKAFGHIKSLDDEQNKIFIFHKRDLTFLRIANVFFYIGFLVSIFVLFKDTTNYNIVIFCIYLVLFSARFFHFHKKNKGKVVYKKDNTPLSFGIIHVIDKNTGNEIFKRKLDNAGNYICLIPNGEYVVSIDEKKEDGTYVEVYRSEILKVDQGIINQNFSI